MDTSISIIKLSNKKVRTYFFEPKSYFYVALPCFFEKNFKKLWWKKDKLNSPLINYAKQLTADKIIAKLKGYQNISYVLQIDKNGKQEQVRNMEMIHPVVYTFIVQALTKKKTWKKIQKKYQSIIQNTANISCLSFPVKSKSKLSNQAETVNSWWLGWEQQTITYALEYHHLIDTDITNCFPSIDLQRISARLTQEYDNKVFTDIFNILSVSQTQDGLPQSSSLSEFLYELYFALIDKQLAEILQKNSIKDYKVLRYRDDYRILTKDKATGEKILYHLTALLQQEKLVINKEKTKYSSDLIVGALKQDKLQWLIRNGWLKHKGGLQGIQKQLLLIYSFSTEENYKNQNSGVLLTALNQTYNIYSKTVKKYLKQLKLNKKAIPFHKAEYSAGIASIACSIARNNPRAIPLCSAIIQNTLILLYFSNKKDKTLWKSTSQKISTYLLNVKCPSLAEIWLYRIKELLHNQEEIACPQILNVDLFNNDWIDNKKVKKKLQTFITEKQSEKLGLIDGTEVSLFAENE